ncbi:hypothetical protein ACVH7G_10870 [Neisseria gonorrhoeae]
MQVLLGEDFKRALKNYPKEDRRKIAEFIAHVQQNGLSGLPGRNKSSDNVPADDPQWLEKSDLPNGTTFGTITSAFPNTTAAGMAI